MKSGNLRHNYLLPVAEFEMVHNRGEYKDCLKGSGGLKLEKRILADITE